MGMYRQSILGAALLLLASGAPILTAEDKPEAAPVGVVKATLFLGEFE